MKRVASYREMDLHLLRRTDNEMLHVGRSNNASSMAASLGSGHAFEVRLAALFPGLGPRLPEVHQRVTGHVTNGWHVAGLQDALKAVLAAWETAQAAPAPAPQVPSGQASDTAATETDSTETTEACSARASELQKYLEMRPYGEADKAIDVARVLTEKLGKEASVQLLKNAKHCSLMGANGKKRKVLKEGCPRGKAWRVRK